MTAKEMFSMYKGSSAFKKIIMLNIFPNMLHEL